jgi:hypothetical protein
MNDNRFYVYAHLRKDGTPFYIGKGKDKRITDKTSRSKWWWDIVKKDYPTENFPTHIKLQENLTEEQSLQLEMQYIQFFGRKNIHENGILINNTDGGEGTAGAILSEATRAKMSNSRKGKKNPMWGKQQPNSVKLAVSKANKGKINVWKGKNRPATSRLKMSMAHGSFPVTFVHNPSGLIVKDVINKNEFSRKYNLNANHIRAIVRGERKTHKGWVKLVE